jgi:SAM-dependent methyltransferase
MPGGAFALMIGTREHHDAPYGSAFFADQRSGSRASGEVVVPLLIELLQPRSVVDVGCGLATWLAVFRESGVDDVFGIDGGCVDPAQLEIPHEHFLAADLAVPLQLDRTFDLAISLEVAEHLPQESSSVFVESLIRLAPVIVFSAAIPYQGGTQHLNEQWPEYWARMFASHGYRVVDWLRPLIWGRSDVSWWYAQNAFLYAPDEYCARHPALAAFAERTDPSSLSRVHPDAYLKAVGWERRAERAKEDVERTVPAGETLLWIDHGKLDLVFEGRLALPFLERDGAYWGAPADGDTAVAELDRMRAAAGAAFAAVAWPAFWWLDYYDVFGTYLRTHFPTVLENDRLIVFDLRG